MKSTGVDAILIMKETIVYKPISREERFQKDFVRRLPWAP
jgi:hypothetical protein